MFDFGNSRASEGVSLYFKLISKKSKTIQNWTATKGYSYGWNTAKSKYERPDGSKTYRYFTSKHFKKLNYIFIKSIACTFYRFTSVITHLECWDNKRKDCTYPFPLFVIYKVSKTNLKNHRTSSVWENKNFDHGYFNRRIRWKFNTDQKKEIMINSLRNWEIQELHPSLWLLCLILSPLITQWFCFSP